MWKPYSLKHQRAHKIEEITNVAQDRVMQKRGAVSFSSSGTNPGEMERHAALSKVQRLQGEKSRFANNHLKTQVALPPVHTSVTSSRS
jgi:hypothetical protein